MSLVKDLFSADYEYDNDYEKQQSKKDDFEM
jgi:hypothetical protein